MYDSILKFVQTATFRHSIRVVAFVVFGVSLSALLMIHAYPKITVHDRPVPVSQEIPHEPEKVGQPVLSRALPVRLEVPSLGIDVPFEEPLALHDDGTIEVPVSYDHVGWYKFGVSPGEIGPAVILGHVDSVDGPAVFYSLGQLSNGDMVHVTRADGTVATFVVEYSERYVQDDFPTEKVYGPTSDSELRLITCTGTYSKGKQRYSHNLVVYARLVSGDEKNSMMAE